MKRSTDRILTTHVGSLARPHELLDTMKERENGRPYDAELLDRQITEARRRPGAPAGRVRHRHRHRRRDEQGQLPRLREGPPRRLRGRHGRRRGWRRRGRRRSTTSPSTTPSTSRSTRRRSPRCAASSARARSATSARSCCRPTSTTSRRRSRRSTWPTCSCRPPARAGSAATSTTPRHEEYLAAVAEAMREEYLAIVDAGFILQVDDPFLIDMLSDPTLERGRARAAGVGPRRGAQPRAARHPDRADPPPHVLRPEPRAADERHPAHRGRAVHAGHQRRGPQLRGGQPAALPRVAHLGGRRSCPTARS